MAILEGVKLSHESAEKLTGQKLNPRSFDWAPQGARIVVIVDRVPDKAGSIAIPESVLADAPSGTGFVVAVGPLLGPDLTAPGTVGMVSVDEPRDLLGKHVSFGYARGIVLRRSILDGEYSAQTLILAPLDILEIDYHPDPLSVDDFNLAYALTKQAAEEEENAAKAIERGREMLMEQHMEQLGVGRELAGDELSTRSPEDQFIDMSLEGDPEGEREQNREDTELDKIMDRGDAVDPDDEMLQRREG